MKSQNALVLKHLKSGKSLTPLTALSQYGIMRLAARIYDLRQQGHDIRGVRFKYKDSRPMRYSMGGK